MGESRSYLKIIRSKTREIDLYEELGVEAG